MDITLSYNASMLSNNNQSSVRQMSKPLSDSDTMKYWSCLCLCSCHNSLESISWFRSRCGTIDCYCSKNWPNANRAFDFIKASQTLSIRLPWIKWPFLPTRHFSSFWCSAGCTFPYRFCPSTGFEETCLRALTDAHEVREWAWCRTKWDPPR